jgi:hypothetical protein
MKLEQLRPNLAELPMDEAFRLFSAYYDKRSEDLRLLTVELIKPRKKASPAKKKEKKKKDEITITPEDLEMLKKLGLC